MKRHATAVLLLIVFTFLSYSSSLNGTWAMDDVVANKPVGINDIQDILGFRKITYITFLLNQHIAPFNPASFRLFNITIHLLNVFLVYSLAYMTIVRFFRNHDLHSQNNDKKRSLPGSPDSLAFQTALLSGAVFALHPININAVAYIVQRMASLATLFVLLALLTYIKGRGSTLKSKAAVFYIMSGIFAVTGIFSKENAVMAVPLILLYDFVFLSEFRTKGFLQRVLVIAAIGVLSIGVASYFLNLHIKIIELKGLIFNPDQPIIRKDWMAIDVYWSPIQHVLTEFRVLMRYLFLILIPLPRLLVFDRWGLPVSHGITEPVTTLFSAAVLFSLLLFSLFKLKRYPLLCFGIIWYFTAISLESFVALGTDLYFEHRNYLPLSGLSIGVSGHLMVSFRERINTKRIWTTLIIICAVLGSLTFSRNLVWKDSLTLWGDTLKKSPSNLRAMMAMGNAHLKSADMNSAETYYKDALTISRNDKRIYYLNESSYSLGMLYLLKRELQPAKELIDDFTQRIESYKPRILAGFYKALNNDIDGALREYTSIINETRGIDRVVVFTLMGDAYREAGKWDEAIMAYNKAIYLDPGFSSAYYGLGASYIGKRDIQRAHGYIKRALDLNPVHMLALSDMADLTLMMKRKPEEALRYAQSAVSKSPPYYQPYVTMGNVLIVMDREKEADEFYNRALERSMPDYMVPFSKARAYYMKGSSEDARRYLSELQKYKDLPEEIQDIIDGNQ
jgi:tetratricopeptide (TPR) repeat protein